MYISTIFIYSVYHTFEMSKYSFYEYNRIGLFLYTFTYFTSAYLYLLKHTILGRHPNYIVLKQKVNKIKVRTLVSYDTIHYTCRLV